MDAIGQYERAINSKSNFGMAIGNKAQALAYLAPLTSYSSGYLILAHQLYVQAISEGSGSIIRFGGLDALERFKRHKKYIEDQFKSHGELKLLTQDLTHENYSVEGRSKKEQSYIQFCLENNLYLNLHVFDLISEGSVGDNISTSFTTAIGDEREGEWVKETFMRLNEIKESYITGRYILWMSQQRDKTTSSISQQSLLVNNLDYTAHNLYTGMLKSAYKEGFSALDKIANAINHYLRLNNSEDKINYRNIWYIDLDKKLGFESKIAAQAYQLFGLYSVLDELGAGPANVRNSLEHKYQRIGTIGLDPHGAPSFDEFTQQTVDVYLKIKNAIIYLINFINSVEDQKHRAAELNGGFVPKMPVSTDQWLDIF